MRSIVYHQHKVLYIIKSQMDTRRCVMIYTFGDEIQTKVWWYTKSATWINKNLILLGWGFCWWSIKDIAPLEQYTCTHRWKASFPTASFGMRTLSLAKPKIKDSNLGPTGYTPREDALGVGATHPASLHDALTEQSARGSLVRAQTRPRLIM